MNFKRISDISKKVTKEKSENGRDRWKTSRILQILFASLLCGSIVLGSSTGVKMLRLAAAKESYLGRGVTSENGFTASIEFNGLLAEYMDLFELYMEIGDIVGQEEAYHEILLEKGGTGGGEEKGITLEQLYQTGGSGYDYRAYAENFINNIGQYSEYGVASILYLTKEIRSLESMVVVEDGKVFYGPQASRDLSEQEKKDIEKQAKKLEDSELYSGNEVVLPDITYEEVEKEAKKVSLLSGAYKAVPQDIYQSWLFKNYPEYADAYMKIVFAQAYENKFKNQDDGLDYSAYRSAFLRDYKKTCYWESSDDFFREAADDVRYSDDHIFYLDTGETITGAELKNYVMDGEKIYDFYDKSKGEYARQLKRTGEGEVGTVKNLPWSLEVVPCSMEMAQDYARFLVDFHKVLKSALENSQFIYYYESEESTLGKKGLLQKAVAQYKSGETEDGKNTENDGGVFYAYYSSNGSIFQTNFAEINAVGLDMQEFLKRVGAAYGKSKNYVCAIGIDMLRVQQPHFSDSDVMPQLYRQFIQEQEDFIRINSEMMKLAWALAGTMLGAVLSLLMLMVMCGRQKERSGVRLRRSRRIWSEIMLFAAVGAAYVFLCMIQNAFSNAGGDYWSDWIEDIGVPGVMACSLLIMSIAALGLVERWKAGTLISGSLVYKCIFLLKRLAVKSRNGFCRMKKYFDEMPVLKQGAVLIGFHVVMGIAAMWYTFGALVYLLDTEDIILMWMIALALLIVDGFCIYRCMKNALADERIRQGASRIAQGELSYKIEEMKGIGKEQADLIEVINHIGEGLERAVEESVRSERMKTELITNVSHDIKTPLTSVINYIDLLKREQIDNDRVREYLEVLDAKSQRLKSLIEDLVEASKASSGAMELQITQLNFNELLSQTNGEFEEKFQQAGLTLVADIPQEAVSFRGDGRRVYRVLENLYGNVAKYAMPGTRVYVRLCAEQDRAVFTIKNISRDQLNITSEELTERFVRGEQSRSTEGSGLGLSIAKNLTELMKGEFKIYLDGDLFRVTVSFPVD